jgi:hypothetical protein
VSAEEDRLLIHRLAAGELDSADEEKRARALIAREPELAALLGELRDLEARVHAAFPEPSPPRESRAFVALMERLTPAALARPAAPPAPRRLEDENLHAPASYLRTASRADAAAAPRVSEGPPSERAMRGFVRRAFRGREPDAGAHLFHLREIPREDGLSVELELYAGDLLALHSEVLLLSAFAGSYHPTPGSLFGAIADRFGIAFKKVPPPGATRHPGGLLHFRGVSCPAFDSLWVLEMVEPGEEFSRKNLRNALDAIGRALPDMLHEASSFTLPLLGTGYQGLDPREVAREILSALPRWASSPRLRTVRVVTHNLEHVAIVNRALDDRDFRASSALDMACRELRRRLERGEWSEPVRAALKDLLAIASVNHPSLQSIALEGRRVAEIVLRGMAREEAGQAHLFAGDVDAEEGRRGDLVTPHLQLLLAHGRAAAAGQPVDSNDAVLIVYAAMRAAEAAVS